jgi:uncharacterized membrane protein YccC
MSVAIGFRPARLAGLPLASWTFALRVSIAVVIALYTAFWLQLESASTAAVCVAILAAPTRGQALEKAGYRFAATVIGIAASVAVVGLFSQTRDLLLLAFAAWIGLCVCVAKLSDGNRAYAAVLSGYTVAIVAIQEIDAPGHVFETGMARGAAIAVGIAAMALVNDLFVAPDRHAGLASQLNGIQRRACAFAKAAIRGEEASTTMAADLLREIAALRPEITSLTTESSRGSNRSAAAHAAAVALVAEVHAARVLATLPIARDPARGDQLVSMLEQDNDKPPRAFVTSREEPSNVAASLDWASRVLLERHRNVSESLAALTAGTRPLHAWRTPLYRSYRFAVEEGARAAIWIALAAAVFILTGWPTTAVSLVIVAVIIGLGALSPNPRGFTAIALVAGLLSTLLTGVLEFLILDGVTAFPLLVLALVPFVMGTVVLMTLPNPLLAGLGRLTLTFVLVILGPSNPQSYSPEVFLDLSLFVCLAALLMLAAQILLPPVSADRRRHWMISEIHRELAHLSGRHAQRYQPEEAMFRDAMRIAQLSSMGTADKQRRADLEGALEMFNQAGMIRLCDACLARLAPGPLADGARKALVARDAFSLRQVANDLSGSVGETAVVIETSAALHTASFVMETQG